MKKIPPETEQKIIEMYQARKTYKEIMAETGVSASTVFNSVRRNGGSIGYHHLQSLVGVARTVIQPRRTVLGTVIAVEKTLEM